MNSRFRFKLSLTMIVFAVAISFTIAITDYVRLREQVAANGQLQVRHIENAALDSLRTVEKAYALFGQDIIAEMKESASYLADKYMESPAFDEWDFQQLKEQLGFDIYIIDENLVITHSSYQEDIGLNFAKCCRKLAALLEERRQSGGFYNDGLDIEQSTGQVKMYGYLATPDKKYIIQLGLSLQDGAIFQEFDFLEEIARRTVQYPSLYEINVLNIGGISFGKPVEIGKLTEERRHAFERTLQTKQTTEFSGIWNNEPAVYRYVYYVSDFDQGTGKNKVLEIIYSNAELQAVLQSHKKTFIVQLFGILVISVALASVISRWVAKPMYLAFHDSLTGLKNRAAFNEMLQSILKENKGTTALMMIDVDNFKWINDYLGHDAGDRFLQNAAQRILSIVREEDIPVRWGGDEFVIIMPNTTKQQAEAQAGLIIAAIRDSCDPRAEDRITVSIGIALAPEHGTDPETLCKQADIALYAAKEQGKNRYRVYSASI